MKQIYDGEWVTPNMRGWKLQCCDCGIIHTLQFRIVRRGKRSHVEFRAWRHPRKKTK